MSKTRKQSRTTNNMRPEYEFDYAQARPNRFSPRLRSKVVAVVLEPDVAEVFDTSESVNQLLRSVISALPHQKRRR
jgi:hypothetical protein